MRPWKVIRWSLLVLLIVVLAAAAGLYVLASGVPRGYDPPILGREQRQQAAQEFARSAADFQNSVWREGPIVWQASEEQINRYLASMDEIAYFRVEARQQEVSHRMRQIGLTGPALRLGEGRVTLMARSVEHDKVVSLVLAAEMTEDRRLRVRLEGARLGRLPMPRDLVEDSFQQLREALARRVRDDAESDAGEPAATDQVLAFLAGMLEAAGGEPVRVEGVVNNRPIRLTDLKIDETGVAMTFRANSPSTASAVPLSGQ